MTENIPVCEKQGKAVGTAFTLGAEGSRDTWVTNYTYYLDQKTAGQPLKPLFGRFPEGSDEDKKQGFEVYIDGEWQAKNYWDYSYAVVDAQGNAEMNKAGKPKSKPYFEKKIDMVLDFVKPIEFDFWDAETKSRVTESHSKVRVRFSRSLADKIIDQTEDPRNGDDAKFIIEFNKLLSPAEMYKVKFSA